MTGRRGDPERGRYEKLLRRLAASRPCLRRLMERKSLIKRMAVLAASALLLAVTGCRQKMMDQPRYEAYEATGLFEDSTVMRPLPSGVVPRSTGRLYRDFYAGTDPYTEEAEDLGGEELPEAYERRLVRTFPFEVTTAVLERGQQQFNIYCAPCHGRVGNGRGMIVQRGLRQPPSFHTERLRNAPPGHFFNVITNGFGAMYSYASRVEPEDRWAITAYIRALQLSQHATLDDVPSDRRAELQLVRP